MIKKMIRMNDTSTRESKMRACERAKRMSVGRNRFDYRVKKKRGKLRKTEGKCGIEIVGGEA
jgi:hypothetical protein